MKLSDITAKLTFLKHNAVRILTTTALAGAALAAVPAANAQYVDRHYVVRGHFYEPFHDRAYWEHRRFEEERARAWRFHHHYDMPYGYR